MLASNIKHIFIAIGLVLIASLIYVFGTSMISLVPEITWNYHTY